MADCIFCKIAAGDLPCWKIWEDDRVLVFLDINPVTEGHTLVIPKAHSSDVTGVSDEDLRALAEALRRTAPAVVQAVSAEGFNILNNCGRAAGQAVEHVHFHVIPRTSGDGRGYRWITSQYEKGKGEELATTIAGNIRH
ncbi:MAG: HIT family protein [Planctomycetota bacterium]|jgi:histidine triad (HIT) family protein